LKKPVVGPIFNLQNNNSYICISSAGDDPRYFQISVPVQPGNSGGALVDERGNVIGIVSAKLDASVAWRQAGRCRRM
jgi:S1-C subfamily serine protease